MKLKFKITGLDCANCAAEIEREIQELEGINSASLSFMSERLEIECDEVIKDDVVARMIKLIKDEEPEVTVEEI